MTSKEEFHGGSPLDGSEVAQSPSAHFTLALSCSEASSPHHAPHWALNPDRAVARRCPPLLAHQETPNNKTTGDGPTGGGGGDGWDHVAGAERGWGGSGLSAVQPSGQEDSHSSD